LARLEVVTTDVHSILYKVLLINHSKQRNFDICKVIETVSQLRICIQEVS
jgi:hypothetical protein